MPSEHSRTASADPIAVSPAEAVTAQRHPARRMSAPGQPVDAVFSVSDPLATGSLHRRLRTVHDATVTRDRSSPRVGELGVVEVLQVVAPSRAVLAVAIRTLPGFIRSLRGSVEVTVVRENRSITVTADNITDIEGTIKRLLDDE